MTMRRFEVDRNEGKLLGVCAGLANHLGVDATFVRVGVVLLALVTSVVWTAIAYFALAMAGSARRARRAAPRRSSLREDTRDRMRDMDLRMQAIETYVTSSNSKLAREIEDLR